MATASKGARKSAPKKSTTTRQQTGMDESSMLMELFIDEIKDIYWAEKHLVKSLPKLQKAATSEELKNAFEEHLEVTRNQVTRLEEIFEMLGKRAQGKKCDGMEGIVKEGDTVIEDTEKGTATRDAGLIISAQKVEHYEIASYGSLVTLANTLGLEDVAAMLQETLDEEKEADELLTSIAETAINIEAAQEDEEEEEE